MSEQQNQQTDGGPASPSGGETPSPQPQQPIKPETAIGGDGAEVETAAENELWRGRTNWKHYAGRFILWFLANVVVAVLVSWVASRADWLGGRGAFWTIVVVLLLTGLLFVAPVFLKILGHRYRITSQRLFIERGILSQTVDQTELIRVDDVRLTKTLTDRLFGLGTVVILSTDASDRDVTIEGVSNPDEVAEAIRMHMRTMRKKSLFVENL